MAEIKRQVFVSTPPTRYGWRTFTANFSQPAYGVAGLVVAALVLAVATSGWYRPAKLAGYIQQTFIFSFNKFLPLHMSIAYAAGQIQAEINRLQDKSNLVHTVTRLIMYKPNGQVDQQITYDLWQDNASARFKNIVEYADGPVVQVNDGFNRWDLDIKDKTLNVEHYVNVPAGGQPKAGDQVKLLSQFQQILDHQTDLKINQGKYNGRPVLILSFSDDRAWRDKDKPQTLYYEYYFDADFKFIGQKTWRLIGGQKTLTEEMVIDKYEIIKRDQTDLDKIFKFDRSQTEDLKVTEVYRDAVSLEVMTPTPPPTGPQSDWQTYINDRYQIKFKYPDNYAISQNSNCTGVTNNPDACLLTLILDPNISQFVPKAHFYLVQGIDKVLISGQIFIIKFDTKQKSWIVTSGTQPQKVLPVWGRTLLGQEIIMAENGGSQIYNNYYIIPDYEENEVAVFAFPKNFKVYCTQAMYPNHLELSRARCKQFIKQIVDQYDLGDDGDDILWLPDEYIQSVYAQADKIIKNFQNPLSGMSQSAPTYEPIIGANEKIISGQLTNDCKLKVVTNQQTFLLPTGYGQDDLNLKCNPANYRLVQATVSNSGKYLAFIDIDGGIDASIKVYSIEHGDTVTLNNFGTSGIFGVLFLPNDALMVGSGFKGVYDEQFVTAFDINALFSNYPVNIDKTAMLFTDLSSHQKVVRLPDIGRDYTGLEYDQTKNQLNLFTESSPSADTVQAYELEELLP